MAHIRKRGSSWVVDVCIDNKRRSKSFPSKRDAQRWAADQEDRGLLANHTLRDAIERYRTIAAEHRGAQADLSRLRSLERDLKCIDTPLAQLTPAMLAKWRDERLTKVAPVSVRREQTILRAMLEVAVREWNWLRENPLESVKRPPSSKPRRRGIAQSEIDAICVELQKSPTGRQAETAFLLSIETGMRRSEVLGLRWEDVREKTVVLRMTKNSDERVVPLSARARELIETRRGLHPVWLFTRSGQHISKTFAAACDAAGCPDVHFHDARSEAITRLSKKLDVMQLAKMIGHRELRSLLIYYAEKPEDIADRL